MKLNRITAAIAIYLCACSGAALAVQTPIRLTPAHSKTGLDLVVDAVGNGIESEFYIGRNELAGIDRLKMNLVRDVDGRPGVVRLSDVGVVRFDEQQAEIFISFKPQFLEPQRLGYTFQNNRFQIPREQSITALMGDYDFRFDHSSAKTRLGVLGSASTWLGSTRLDASVIAGTSIKSQFTNLRLVKEDLSNSSLIEAGTITSFSGSFSSPGQIMGFGIRKNRGITPGFITGPQLRVDGVSNARSTIDLLVNNQLTKHTTQPGPFSVIAEPVSNGLVSVIVRDEFGMEKVVTSRLFANPSLIGVGQTEYALSAGGASIGGLRTNGFLASGYYRQGFSNWLTSEAGFEATSRYKRVTLASDVGTVIGDFGVDLAVGGGRAGAVRYSLPVTEVKGWFVSGGATYAHKSAGFQQPVGPALDKTSIQRGVNLSVSTPGWSLNTTLASTSSGRFISSSVGHNISSSGASVNLTAMRFSDAFGKASNSVFLSLSMPLDGKFASISASNTNAGTRKNFSFGGRVNDDLSMSVNADGIRGIERVGASASANLGRVASANFGVMKPLNGSASYRGSVRGGLIAHESGVTLSGVSSPEAGFAIVDLGAPGVEVYNGFGSRAVTGSNGVAVLKVPSLEKTRITLDPSSAPDGLDLSPIEINAHRRGGVFVSRKAEVTNGRFVNLQGAVAGDVVQVGGDSLPVTDRGVWLELGKGAHVVKLNGVSVEVAIN